MPRSSIFIAVLATGLPLHGSLFAQETAERPPAAPQADRAADDSDIPEREVIDTMAGTAFGRGVLDERISTGEVFYSAQKAWIWSQPAGSRSPTAVRRIHLVGNVSIRLAGTDIRADRATVWMQRVPAARSGVAGELYQVFAYVENARAPANASGVTRADKLQLRGLVNVTARPALRVDLGSGGQPEEDHELRFIDEGARQLLAVVDPGNELITEPASPQQDSGPAPNPVQDTTPSDSVEENQQPRETDAEAGTTTADEPASSSDASPASTDLPPIFPTGSVISIAAGDRITADTIEGRRVVIATGGVIVQVEGGTGLPGQSRGTELTAQRVVLTLRNSKGGGVGADVFQADDVESIYLEGGFVAGDGTYTVRASRAFYDVTTDRGVVYDGVLWTYDQRRQLPVYVRAERFRQLARSRWDATDAVVANNASPVPGIGVGVGSVVVDKVERSGGEGTGMNIDARDLTVRLGTVPVVYWPRYKGDASRPALRTIGYEDSNREGFGIKTDWDLLALLSIEDDAFAPTKLDATGQLDIFSDRGLGVGTELSWQRPDAVGRLQGYILPDDRGVDVLYRGAEIEREGEVRGSLFFEQRLQITQNWELITEGAWISDEAYLVALDPRRASIGREITTRAVLQRSQDNSLFTLGVSGTFLDFQPNEYLLQSQGYSVIRAPEARYTSGYRDLFPESAPGVFGYNWDATLGMMRLAFGEVDAASIGFTDNTVAMAALGIGMNESTGDALRAAGLNENYVTRFDTRHELSAKFLAGPVSITPFAVGRVTLYDNGFEDFSPDETDRTRLWGAVGVDLWTEFSKVDNAAFSRVFDVNRLRHVVEPRLTIMAAGTSIEAVDLPVYDDEIESLADGVLVRAAVDQTWQTKRGGPGRWRNVDLFTLRTAYVWSSEEAEDIDPDDEESAFPDFILFRPELSNPGEYVSAESTWHMTDAIAFAGETIFDLDTNQQARSSAGFIVRHSPVFSTSGEIRFLNPRNVTYGSVNAFYELTEKYNASLFGVYDFEQDDFQNIGVGLERRLPAGSFYISINHNNINGETSFGIAFSPLGMRSRVGLTGIGSDNQQF